jgi:hypothetical protein
VVCERLVKLGIPGLDGCHAFGQSVITHVAIRIGVGGCGCLQGTQADQAQSPAHEQGVLSFGNHGWGFPCCKRKHINKLISFQMTI